jgi:hypothetical protein
MKIFLSYRQADALQAFREILKRLQREFGAENVFHDTDVRNTGKPFPPNLTAKIQEANAVIAVIGRHWLREGAASDQTDWVLKEIETALESSAQIYPLLVRMRTSRNYYRLRSRDSENILQRACVRTGFREILRLSSVIFTFVRN